MRKGTLLHKSLLYSTTTALLFSFYPSVQAAGTTEGPTDAAEVQQFADQLFSPEKLKMFDIPGAAFVVVKDGKVLFEKGYGYADVAAQQPVDVQNTAFRLASVSKVFTATAAMQMVEQGKLALNADVNQYLDYKLKNIPGSPITLEHLLTHTSGLAPVEPTMEELGVPLSDDYALGKWLSERNPDALRKPGSVYVYDNYASGLQGYLVERVSGKPFNSYVEENIFKPLGMTKSSFRTVDLQNELAVGYDPANNPMPIYGIRPTEMPQGGMVATASDVGKYMIAQLNEGQYGDQRILKEETAKEMQKYHFSLAPDAPDMGYGFEAPLYPATNGEHVIAKGGDIPGFSSYMWLLPEENVGAFVVYNKSGDALRAAAFTEFMNHYYPSEEPEPAYLTTPKAELARFDGFYQYLRAGTLTFQLTATGDGELTFTFAPMQITKKLHQIAPLLFVDEDGAKMSFKENEAGDIQYMTYAGWAGGTEKLAKAPLFPDVDPNSPYAPYIEALQNRGLLQGNPDGTFGPTDKLTRAQYVTMLLRVTNIPASKNPVVFEDAKDSFAAAAIQTAYEYGIVKGTSATTFSPNAEVKREEAAAMLYRTLTIDGSLPPAEADLAGETSDWALEAVKTLVAMKLYGPDVILGKGGAIDYRSQDAMTRQEAVLPLSLLIAPPAQQP